jgi:site-specific recombinase XerC
MASVFKRGRDKNKKGSPWHFEFKDHKGKKTMRKGFTDKGLTQQLATKLETEADMRRKGLIDGEQEERAERRSSDIREHLRAYRTSLEAKKNTEKHIKLIMGRIERIIKGCGFVVLGDLDATEVESYLTKLRKKEGFGHRTYNHYLQAIEAFCNWLVARRRLGENPVVGIPRLNANTDVRHQRRALTAEEFAKLVQSAIDSDKSIQCYTGEERACIYILSYMTGLRRSELASLTTVSFDLDAEQPTLTVAAGASKHRREDVLPLHPELTPMIRDWIVGLEPDEPLFPKLAKRRTWLMVKKDLERVGIPYETKEGFADFHAAGRHSHITGLLKSGVSVPHAMALARHRDVRMTMRYTHLGIDEQAEALKNLPTVWQDIGRKPGVFSLPAKSSAVSKRHNEDAGRDDVSPDGMSPSDTDRHKKAPPVMGGAEWRRRESNPRPCFSK